MKPWMRIRTSLSAISFWTEGQVAKLPPVLREPSARCARRTWSLSKLCSQGRCPYGHLRAELGTWVVAVVFDPPTDGQKCVPQSQPYAVSGIQSEYRCRPWHAGSTGEDQFPRKRMLNGCEVVPPEWE